ncbi:MAG TPA: TonB-dependent receptor, partial [Sphingobium sp.]|nr:TonB-dependent receptor [Sphingobium sp.]
AWDLDRVEILRGPQGTLFGEGSLGGTVRILTQGADLDRWEAKSDAYLSQTREGGTNRGVKAAFNAPLVPGQFAVRLSGTLEHLPGWIDNDAARTHNINDQTYKTLRVRTRFNPTDRLSINGSYWYYKGDFPAGPANATDTGQQSRSLVQATQSRYEMRGLSAHYDLGLAKAFYGYSHSSFFLPQTGYYLGGSIISDIAIGVTAHEMRLSSSSGDPLQWTVGAYLREARRRDIFQFHQFDIDNVDRTTSWARALFGEATYRLPFAPIDLTAGLRYYRERLEGFEVNSGVPADQGSHVYRSWNPRFSIAWHPRANSILYASAAKGFRAGQLQPTISAQLAGPLGITLPDALRQDYIWTYELGTKVEMADGLLTFEAALYRSHWRNVAVRLPLGNTGYNGLINSPGTRTTGVEASLFLAPARGLTISAGGSWIDASYSGTVPGTGIVEGAPVDDVARFTASAATEYRHGFTERLAAFARLAWQHNSPRDNSAFAIYRPGDAIDRFDLRLGLEVDRLSITLFIDNLTDDRDASSPRIVQPIADGDVDITATRLRPRTVGIELSTYFGRGM